MVNKTTDENLLKAKLGIFVKDQGITSVESLWKGATDHESLRATDLNRQIRRVGSWYQSYKKVLNYTNQQFCFITDMLKFDKYNVK